MKIKTAESIWKAYCKCNDYNDSINDGIGLTETVKQNENFYIGRQWEGVTAPDIDKTTFNIIKRVVNYLIAMIIADDIAVQLTPFVRTESSQTECKIIKTEIERIFEKTKTKTRLREVLRNCAVDGDGCLYAFWDNSRNDPKLEVVDNTKLLFGNPFEREADEQPYIILVKRHKIDVLKEQLEAEGMEKSKIESIHGDEGTEYYGEDTDASGDIVTELVYMWREKGTVHFMRTTKDLILKEDTDTGYRHYPVGWMNWDTIKNSYHGQSPITGLIPNQVYVNKLLAMSLEHEKRMAFPKIFYDMTKIRNWSNKIGQAIGVVGDVNSAAMDVTKTADVNGMVTVLVDKVVDYTKDFMGANDAALGNVNPENTSAIIAVQKAATAPLELQRQGFYQFVEDIVKILIEMMRVNYGVREVSFTDDDGNDITAQVDFGKIQYDRMQLNIDIGGGGYFNEITQVSTMDKLLQNGIITDPIAYLDAIPDKYIFNKHAVMAKMKQAQMAQMQQQVMGNGVENQQYNPLDTIQAAQERIGEQL